jgi:hypothetical protein
MFRTSWFCHQGESFYTQFLYGKLFMQVCILYMYIHIYRKVAGSIPDGVIGIFHSHNPADRTMALGSTQPLTELSKGKAVPLQAWSGPEGSRKLRFPDYMTTA